MHGETMKQLYVGQASWTPGPAILVTRVVSAHGDPDFASMSAK